MCFKRTEFKDNYLKTKLLLLKTRLHDDGNYRVINKNGTQKKFTNSKFYKRVFKNKVALESWGLRALHFISQIQHFSSGGLLIWYSFVDFLHTVDDD